MGIFIALRLAIPNNDFECGLFRCLCYGGGNRLMRESMILCFSFMLLGERKQTKTITIKEE